MGKTLFLIFCGLAFYALLLASNLTLLEYLQGVAQFVMALTTLIGG